MRHERIDLSETAKRWFSVGTIGGFGVILGLFEVWHTLMMESFVGKVLQAIVPFIVAIAVVATSYWLFRSEFSGDNLLRITGWFFVGMIGLAVIGMWMISHQFIRGGMFHHWQFVTVSVSIMGGAVGLIIGIYDGLRRRHENMVATSRERIAAEQQRVAFLNSLLRHDVMNAINLIEGRAQLQKSSTDTDDTSNLDIIINRCEEIMNLIDRVRIIADRTLSEGSLPLRPVDLCTILDEQIANVRETYPEATIDAELPENVTVRADEMLSEVFGNLLANAIEHNHKDEPEVEVSVEKRSETVVVDIADNGPGIPSELADNLFEWSVNQETDSSTKGMGLRLVTTLVSEYGGEVWAEENSPEGSIIHVELEQDAPGGR